MPDSCNYFVQLILVGDFG